MEDNRLDQEQELKHLFQTNDPVALPAPYKAITEALHARRANNSLWQKPIPLYQVVISCVLVSGIILWWMRQQVVPVSSVKKEVLDVAPIVRRDTIYVQLPVKAAPTAPKVKSVRKQSAPKIDQPVSPPMAVQLPAENLLEEPLGDLTIQSSLFTTKDGSVWDTIAGFTIQERQDYFRFLKEVQ